MPRDRQQPTADAAVADRRRPQQELCHVAWCLFRYTGRPLGHSWGTRAPVCFQSFRAEVDHRCIFTALVHYSVSPVHTPRLAGCTITDDPSGDHTHHSPDIQPHRRSILERGVSATRSKDRSSERA